MFTIQCIVYISSKFDSCSICIYVCWLVSIHRWQPAATTVEKLYTTFSAKKKKKQQQGKWKKFLHSFEPFIWSGLETIVVNQSTNEKGVAFVSIFSEITIFPGKATSAAGAENTQRTCSMTPSC